MQGAASLGSALLAGAKAAGSSILAGAKAVGPALKTAGNLGLVGLQTAQLLGPRSPLVTGDVLGTAVGISSIDKALADLLAEPEEGERDDPIRRILLRRFLG